MTQDDYLALMKRFNDEITRRFPECISVLRDKSADPMDFDQWDKSRMTLIEINNSVLNKKYYQLPQTIQPLSTIFNLAQTNGIWSQDEVNTISEYLCDELLFAVYKVTGILKEEITGGRGSGS